MKCKVCGYEIGNSNYCPNCGAKVRVKNCRNNEIEEFFEENNSRRCSNDIFGIVKWLFNGLKSVVLLVVFFLYDLIRRSK